MINGNLINGASLCSIGMGTGGSSAPRYSRGEIGSVDSQTIAVTFSKAVNATGLDFITGVTIKVNNATVTIASAIRQSNQAIVYYVLDDFVTHDDVVTWAYDKSSGSIKDLNGIALENVTAKTITNNIPMYSLDFSIPMNSMYSILV